MAINKSVSDAFLAAEAEAAWLETRETYERVGKAAYKAIMADPWEGLPEAEREEWITVGEAATLEVEAIMDENLSAIFGRDRKKA